MDGEQYDLDFGSRKFCVVVPLDSDFPNLWGAITYEPWVSRPRSPEEQRLARFLALNKENTRLADLGRDGEGARAEAAVNAELEAAFLDNIECDSWRLVDCRGQERPILCPILRGDGELVWRWDPGREGA